MSCGARGLERPAQRDHLTTTTLVPLPGLEVSSNSSTSRRAPDRPRPRPTPELQPSVRARSTSAMPGPSSVKPILTPLLPSADVTTSTRASAAAAVHQGVAGQLAGRRHHLGLVHQGQAALGRDHPHLLPDADDVVSRPDRQLIHQARSVQQREALLRVQRGAHAAQRQAQLGERDRHRRAHADQDRLGVEQPRDRPDHGQHPADEGVHDLHRGDVDDHPVGAGGGQFVRQVLLEPHDALVLQVDLDGDEERCPDLEDRHAVHQAGPASAGGGWPGRAGRCAGRGGSARAPARRPASPWWRCRRTRCRATRSSARPAAGCR